MKNPEDYPYSYTFGPDHPNREDQQGLRWRWLIENVGLPGELWDWSIPWTREEDLVYHFANGDDCARFILSWG